MNFEAVTARYVDVRLERKKEVLDAYHNAVEKAEPPKAKEAEPKKAKGKAKKKSTDLELWRAYLFTASYGGLYLSVELGRQMGVKTDFFTAATGTGKAAKT